MESVARLGWSSLLAMNAQAQQVVVTSKAVHAVNYVISESTLYRGSL